MVVGEAEGLGSQVKLGLDRCIEIGRWREVGRAPRAERVEAEQRPGGLTVLQKRFVVPGALLSGDLCTHRVALSLGRAEGLQERGEFSQGSGSALRTPFLPSQKPPDLVTPQVPASDSCILGL